MKLSVSSLKEYLDINLSPTEIANTLTLGGLEVEEIAGEGDNALLDIALTPNLGHCMSVYGIARELSALLDIPLQRKEPSLCETGEDISQLIHIRLVDKHQCLRYACRLVTGVQISPSPQWLQNKLTSYGVRSINNVVDIGNLVMLEQGQPLHMFDYDTIVDKTLYITSHTDFQELKTLDGIVRPIPPDSLLICDSKHPLAFAGIIGGASSAVDLNTHTVLIEAAYFTPASIRKTSKWLHLKSDASQRFERGIDPNALVTALNTAAALLNTVAGGTIARGIIDIQTRPFLEKKIVCRPQRVNQLLGTRLSHSDMIVILRRLGMTILEEHPHAFTVSIPTHRNDLSIEEDLIEEIARVYGYTNIPLPIPSHVSSTLLHAPIYLLEQKMRRFFLAQGLQEMLTCDLLHPAQAAMALENHLPQEALIPVLHPSSIDQSVLRASLLPGLLQTIKHNHDHGNSSVAAFEVGRIHLKTGEDYIEPSAVGVIMTGMRMPDHFAQKREEFDFFDLKGIIENLQLELDLEALTFERSHLSNFHPHRQAYIKYKDTMLGALGEVHPRHLHTLDLQKKVYYAEMNLNELLTFIPSKPIIPDISPFPGSERDWTVTLPEEMAIGLILETVHALPSNLLEDVMLLDLYKSDQIGKDKKNATFRFFYRDKEKTISFEAAEQEHARLVNAVRAHLKLS